MKNKLTIGTRSSKLALYQSNLVKSRLEQLYPDITFELLNIKTKGDIMIDKVLDRNIDKGFFVSEIQNMLIKNEIDIAVHSLKDMPVEQIDKLRLSAVLKRGNPQDVFLSNHKKRIEDFTKNDIIGTTSLRRKAQILSLNENLNIIDVRGNVGTRINKMIDGNFDGLVMAAAGIERLNLEQYITEYFELNSFLNAPGQGAIAVETNIDNLEATAFVSKINHEQTMICTTNERNFMKKMGGGCNYPIGAYSYIKDNTLFLDGIVLSLDGKKSIRHKVSSKNLRKDLSIELSQKFKKDHVIELLKKIDDEIK